MSSKPLGKEVSCQRKHKYVSHHIVFVWFLSLLLLDWDLFRDQTVRGHHHIIVCKSTEQRGKNRICSLGSYLTTNLSVNVNVLEANSSQQRGSLS